jgi:hypothetical protein
VYFAAVLLEFPTHSGASADHETQRINISDGPMKENIEVTMLLVIQGRHKIMIIETTIHERYSNCNGSA